jgi:hypothetical protein
MTTSWAFEHGFQGVPEFRSPHATEPDVRRRNGLAGIGLNSHQRSLTHVSYRQIGTANRTEAICR